MSQVEFPIAQFNELIHDNPELHYIGNGLKVPTLVNPVVNGGAASVGVRPAAAREDHTHAFTPTGLAKVALITQILPGTTTFTMQATTVALWVSVAGGGGGGGSGRRGVTAVIRNGGGGGAGGGFSRHLFNAQLLYAINGNNLVFACAVGTGGGGGAAQNVDSTNGNNGNNGNNSWFGGSASNPYLSAAGGAFGGGGGLTGVPGAAGVNTLGQGYGELRGADGAASVNGLAGVGGQNNYPGPGGGGSGGALTAANGDTVGGPGQGCWMRWQSFVAGGALGGGDGAGGDNSYMTPGGGGGGGGSRISGGRGGNGGVGGFMGGGGGGGGASLNGQLSGAGGAGGDGKIWVIELF